MLNSHQLPHRAGSTQAPAISVKHEPQDDPVTKQAMTKSNSTNTNTSTNTNANYSSFLPPPPIFKPRFVPIQRSGSSSEAIATTPSSSLMSNSNSTTNNASSTSLSSYESVSQVPNINGNSNNNTSQSSLNNNSNFLTSSFVSNEEYRKNNFLSHSPSISPMTRFNEIPLPDDENPNSNQQGKTRKRRRSSSLLNNKEEIERKKKELKNQHSIIEKRRRIKMNREFEALKFLVPACRLNILTGLTENKNFDNSNMMHKLTILQSTVEYIKYLHLIIKLMKLQMLIPKDSRENFKSWFHKNNNLNFVDFDLDLQSYRNIEEEFDFEEMFLKIYDNEGDVPNDMLDPITKEILKVLKPDFTAEIPRQSQQSIQHQQRSKSIPNIQTPSTILEERIQENSEYRNSILKSQQDIHSFKLPLPAIIDKHPDLGVINQNLSKPPSPVSPFKNAAPITSTSMSPLKTPYQNHPFIFTTTIPQSQVANRQHHVLEMNNYSFKSNANSNSHRLPSIEESMKIAAAAAASNLSTPFSSSYSPSSSVTPPAEEEQQIHSSQQQDLATEDRHSPEIHAASRLLIEIKSSKRHPTIQNILN